MISTQRQYALGIISIGIGFYAYWGYVSDMIKGKTKPHIFSWIIWTLGLGVIISGQISGGAGAGSWTNITTAGISIWIIYYAYTHGSRVYITKIDWVLFIGALIALGLYFITSSRRRSMLLINIVETLGMIPTLHKVRNHPHTETISMYGINTIKLGIIVLATANFSFITASNTILWIILNLILVITIYRRRKIISP